MLKKNFKALALNMAFKAIAALKKEKFKALKRYKMLKRQRLKCYFSLNLFKNLKYTKFQLFSHRYLFALVASYNYNIFTFHILMSCTCSYRFSALKQRCPPIGISQEAGRKAKTVILQVINDMANRRGLTTQNPLKVFVESQICIAVTTMVLS